MIYKMCRKCKKPIKHPNTYCSNCLPLVIERKEQFLKERNNRYNKKRDPKYKAFYNSSEWILLKNKKMQDEQYRCEDCHKLAIEVHHIKPIQTDAGWELRLDYNNLAALCISCHNARHKRFQRKKVRR